MILTQAQRRMLSAIAEAGPAGILAVTLNGQVVAQLIIAGLVRSNSGRIDDVYLTATADRTPRLGALKMHLASNDGVRVAHKKKAASRRSPPPARLSNGFPLIRAAIRTNSRGPAGCVVKQLNVWATITKVGNGVNVPRR
jgi:hypothetical protein